MARRTNEDGFTKLEIVLSLFVVGLLVAVVVATLQPNPKNAMGSAVNCPGLTGLRGTNTLGDNTMYGVKLAPHTLLCEGQKVTGPGIAKGTIIEAALETGRRVGVVVFSKPTTKRVRVFSTTTLRSKTGWYGDNGYFAAVGNNGLGYAGSNITGGGGGGGDDGGD